MPPVHRCPHQMSPVDGPTQLAKLCHFWPMAGSNFAFFISKSLRASDPITFEGLFRVEIWIDATLGHYRYYIIDSNKTKIINIWTSFLGTFLYQKLPSHHERLGYSHRNDPFYKIWAGVQVYPKHLDWEKNSPHLTPIVKSL